MVEPAHKSVLVPVANGCEELETVAIIDILRRAGCDVLSAKVSQQHVNSTVHWQSGKNDPDPFCEVALSRGLKMKTDVPLEDILDKNFDLIALPGGFLGAQILAHNPHLISLLKKHMKSNRLTGAICASPVLVLCNRGLLLDYHDEHHYTCHPAVYTEIDPCHYDAEKYSKGERK